MNREKIYSVRSMSPTRAYLSIRACDCCMMKAQRKNWSRTPKQRKKSKRDFQ